MFLESLFLTLLGAKGLNDMYMYFKLSWAFKSADEILKALQVFQWYVVL